jgi:hypothetical protein
VKDRGGILFSFLKKDIAESLTMGARPKKKDIFNILV